MKRNKNLQGCVCPERERERGRRGKPLREGASVTLVQSKWKVETVLCVTKARDEELSYIEKCIETLYP